MELGGVAVASRATVLEMMVMVQAFGHKVTKEMAQAVTLVSAMTAKRVPEYDFERLLVGQ